MAFLGNQPAAQFTTIPTVQRFNGTGSATEFTLDRSVASVQSIMVSVDGVIQDTSSYTIPDGVTLTFSSAPSSGTGNIFINYLGLVLGTVTHPSTSSLSATSGTFSTTLAVTGETTLATHLNMGDSDIIKLGDGADLLIYHDASNSYIADTGTGELRIKTDSLNIQNAAGNKSLIRGVEDAAVTLYYNDGIKLVTNNTGVTVTGIVSATSFAGNGSVGGTLGVTGNVTLGGQLIMPDVTSAKILVADGTSYQEVAVSGDVTIANTGAVTIAANAVEASMLASAIGAVGMWSKVAVRDTAAITDSLNTSGITDNSVGDFTIAINANLGDANYGVNVTTGDDDGTNRNVGEVTVRSQAAGTVQIQHFQATPSESSQRGSADCDIAYVSCFDN